MIDSGQMALTELAEYCQLAEELSSHIVYRLLLGYSFLACFIATPAQIYFFVKICLKFHCQGNIKFLLNVYFFVSLLFSLISACAFGWRNIVTQFATDCNLLINKFFFTAYHLPSLFLMTLQMLIPVGFSIERYVALKNAGSYEHRKTRLGPVLTAILAAVDSLVMLFLFCDEPFHGPFISLILVPPASAAHFNIYCVILLLIQIGNLVVNVILLKKQKIQPSVHNLSYRYEMEEFKDATNFILFISFWHIVFAGSYVIGGSLARLVGPMVFDKMVHYTAARAMFCAMPTYNVFIVFAAMWKLNKIDQRKKGRMEKDIELNTIGNAGIENYNKVSKMLVNFE
ncbi:hypothetical protein L3Y34_011498 [Caenorhabditis briggsae]|uniref:Uncharacterized protein n=1 Tax=Caenorhabditis briggsae TaxID=6238 RepID=A0AAE8ZNZ7_CAEBR|nr:hypothetical protein L3Y34_011498 [Caenorhabditis briggsae]